MLVDDLTHFGTPSPKRRSSSARHNHNMELRRAINMIQKENNQMVICRNRFYMLSEAHRQAKKSNRKINPTVITEINSMPNCSSNIEMSNEET